MTRVKFRRALDGRYCIDVRGNYIGIVYKDRYGGWVANTFEDKWGFGDTRREAVQELFKRRSPRFSESAGAN